MTSEYSIELQAENINNTKSKQYFQEVLSSYINGNYRSAIVVLWTVTVCDLIYKLQDLSTIYNDTSAEKILKEITKKQEENKKSPEWEAELIKLIEDRTVMFATYEITHIQSLQTQRHLSAHPVIKEDLDLYQPNKETTRALIRNTLEFVLTKPSMASNKIFHDLIADLEEKRDLFPDIEDLESYITPKYYLHIPDKVKQYIFKQLWKFSFKLNNTDSKSNRRNNIRALAILYKKNNALMEDLMLSEKSFFASNINLHDDMDMAYFVAFSNKYPKIYTQLDDVYKPPIFERLKKDNKLWAQSFFLYTDTGEYLEALENDIGLEDVTKDKSLSKKIIDYCAEHDASNDLAKLYIDQYTDSGSYDTANERYDALIEPLLPLLSINKLQYLLEKIETNNQVYHRGRAYSDHKKIKERCDDLNEDFDYAAYPHFLRSIGD